MRIRFLIIALLVFVTSYPAAAQEENAPPRGSKELEEMKDKLTAKLDDMSKDMNEQEQQHFQMSYNNYILINMVKTVQKDVGEAVKSCGEKNPDLKDKMETRFASWNDAVNPVLKDSQGNLDNMVIAQDYASKEDMQDVFNYIDKTREISRAQVERVPVTTPEACEHLHNKMGETQDTMVKLLSQTLVTFPRLAPEEGE